MQQNFSHLKCIRALGLEWYHVKAKCSYCGEEIKLANIVNFGFGRQWMAVSGFGNGSAVNVISTPFAFWLHNPDGKHLRVLVIGVLQLTVYYVMLTSYS